MAHSSPARTADARNVFAQNVDPIAALYPQLDSEICRRCTARIFPQCHIALPDGQPRTATNAASGREAPIFPATG